MKKTPIYKTWLFWIFVVIILIAPFIPCALSRCLVQKEGVWTIGKWSAGEILGYIGAVLGGFITFVGVAMTINNENERFKDTLRSDVLPYISFFANDYVNNSDTIPDKALTLLVDENYIFWNKHIDPKTYVAQRAERRIYPSGALLYMFDNKIRMFDIKLKNVGKGIAKSLMFECEGKSSMKVDLDTNEEMRLIISLDKKMPEDILVKLKYENLYDDSFEIDLHIYLKDNQYEIEINR